MADRPSLTHSIGYFGQLDLNDEPDTSGQRNLAKFEACKERLLCALGKDRQIHDAAIRDMISFIPPAKPETFDNIDANLIPQTYPHNINRIARPLKKMQLRMTEAFCHAGLARWSVRP